MKRKLLTVLTAIAMLIPGIIAVINYAYLKNTPIEYRNLAQLDITDLAGDVFNLQRGADNASDSALEFFVSLNKNAKKVDSLPEDLAQGACFTFTYHSYSVKTNYKYYFSLDADKAYYTNDTGTTYKISAADATSFLCTCYARSLYEGAAVPALTLSDQNPVTPSTVKWTFRTVSSQYIDYAPSYETTKALGSYEVSSNFGMKFSVEPDFFYITIVQDGTEIYKGDYASMSISSALSIDKTATVEISAEWYEAVDRVYAGSATYRFEANLVPPPTFTAASSDDDYVEKGSMVVFTGKNVKNAADITFTCVPDIGYTPKWFANSETGSVYALLPIGIGGNYDNATEFVFTIESGGTVSTIRMNYQNNRFETLSGLSESDFESNFADITAQIGEPADASVYFSGAFANPVSATSGLKGFGRLVDSAYRHNGVDFTNVTSQSSVSAGAAGTVAYIGNLSSGQTAVVIEHGLGLRSWYVNLGSVNADLSIGSTVAKGDTIGTCTNSSLHCSITVYGVPVSPYKFWSFTADNTEFLNLK